MRYFWRIAVAVFICAAGEAFASGHDGSPQRIISLSPCVTEELYLLGVEDRVVGVTRYCERPPQAAAKEKVGAVVDVNLEKIIGLNPDLVIATSLTDPKSVEKLKNLGIAVITINQAKDFTRICEQLSRLGEVTGKKEEAENIIRKATDRVSAITKSLEGAPRVKVFVQVGAKPLVTAGRESFINNIITLARGTNIAEGSAGESYMPYSREKVLEADPDHIIVVTMGIAGEKERATWESFKNLKAAENKNIHVVNSYDICSLTPVTFVKALENMAGILHPGIKVE